MSQPNFKWTIADVVPESDAISLAIARAIESVAPHPAEAASACLAIAAYIAQLPDVFEGLDRDDFIDIAGKTWDFGKSWERQQPEQD